jgi:hypothetical protein
MYTIYNKYCYEVFPFFGVRQRGKTLKFSSLEVATGLAILSRKGRAGRRAKGQDEQGRQAAGRQEKGGWIHVVLRGNEYEEGRIASLLQKLLCGTRDSSSINKNNIVNIKHDINYKLTTSTIKL